MLLKAIRMRFTLTFKYNSDALLNNFQLGYNLMYSSNWLTGQLVLIRWLSFWLFHYSLSWSAWLPFVLITTHLSWDSVKRKRKKREGLSLLLIFLCSFFRFLNVCFDLFLYFFRHYITANKLMLFIKRYYWKRINIY